MASSASSHGRHKTVRVPALDAAHSQRRTTVVVGPLDAPPVDELNRRFAAMARHGAATRLHLHPSPTSTRWILAAPDQPAVTETPALPAGADPLTLIPRVRSVHNGRGIAIITTGDYLAIDFSHGLGEVFFVHYLLDSLLGEIDPADPAQWVKYRHSLSPLLIAGARTFGRNPRKALELAAMRREQPAPPTAPSDGQHTWAGPAGQTTRTIGLPGDLVARVRKHRDATLPGVSLVALFTHALWTALTDAGVSMNPVVKMPFDVRRYLPPTRDTLATFSAGLDFEIDPAQGPAPLHAAMRRAAATGRPVANLLLGTVATRRQMLKRSTGEDAAPLAVQPIQLLHSNIGDFPRTDRWSFTDRSSARVLVASDPADRNAITITSATTLGNLWFTAEFHSSAIEPEAVTAALQSIVDQAESDSIPVNSGTGQ